MWKKFLTRFALSVVPVLILIPAVKADAGQVLWEPLDGYNQSIWTKSNGYKNGDSVFNCNWRAGNVNFSAGKMELSITNDVQGANPPYACGEYKSNSYYGYGLYEVSMKPAAVSGVISSFFTYTGPSFNAPWDEIDIEFLGNKTNKVQFNYYTNGVGHHEILADLGFDASQGFHTYAFDWQPGYIKWYVDGVLKATATNNIPSHPGKIMTNLWNTNGVDEWAGHYNGNRAKAVYDWIKFTPSQ